MTRDELDRRARRAAPYSEASRQADNAMRALFMRRTPAERERMPASCIPDAGGTHRQLSFGHPATLNSMHGLDAARRYRGL